MTKATYGIKTILGLRLSEAQAQYMTILVNSMAASRRGSGASRSEQTSFHMSIRHRRIEKRVRIGVTGKKMGKGTERRKEVCQALYEFMSISPVVSAGQSCGVISHIWLALSIFLPPLSLRPQFYALKPEEFWAPIDKGQSCFPHPG